MREFEKRFSISQFLQSWLFFFEIISVMSFVIEDSEAGQAF
jgi:hypothetical protein